MSRPYHFSTEKTLSALHYHFNEVELKTLCSWLNVDYEGLPGVTKAEKAQSMVDFALENDLAYTLNRLIVGYRRNVVRWEQLHDVAPERHKVAIQFDSSKLILWTLSLDVLLVLMVVFLIILR